jgi:ABC-type transport system substrate-binding protein/transcriptional regulator with XRE-family HTH domain
VASTTSLTFAELLRYHRMAAGLTQEELAALAQLSVDAISTLERGARRTPRKDTVALLADALNLLPEDRTTFLAAATSARRTTSAALAASPPASPVPNNVPDVSNVQTDATTIGISPPQSTTAFIVDIWSAMREHLIVVVAMTLVLLTLVGLLVPIAIPTFPRMLALVTGAATFVLLSVDILVHQRRHASITQWRATRRPLVLVLSMLTLIVVMNTLRVAGPAPLVQSYRAGYDFSYTPHRPTHSGGSITVGWSGTLQTLAPDWIGDGLQGFTTSPIYQGCVVQLPDQTLGLAGWKADQCTNVPTVENGGESPDEKTTTFHVDARAVWSDGVPITSADFLFGQRLAADPNLTGGFPFDQMTLTALDADTVQIHWAAPYPDFLTALSYLIPVPLHVYATGRLAGIFNPTTGAYDSTLAQQLRTSPAFNTLIPVDNGPFSVKSFISDKQAVLVRNPRFFSNFFHSPALDKITLIPAAADFLPQIAAGLNPVPEMEADLIQRYQHGTLDLALSLTPLYLRQLGYIPRGQVEVAAASDTIELAFNERRIAPNARANGGISVFTDRTVRQAFIEAFNRCAAVQSLLGDVKCGDPNIFTDESDATAAVAAYDPSFKLPAYNPIDAERLMDAAGYPVVDGVRRNKDGVTPLALRLVVSPGASGSASIARQMQEDYTRSLQVGVVITDDQFAFWNQTSPLYTGAFDLMLDDSQNSVDPIKRLTLDLAGPFDSASIQKGLNPFGIIDAEASQRDQLAALTPSDAQRSVILVNLHRYFSQQYYVEPMYIQAVVALKTPFLCNFKLWPDPGSLFWNIADWYVASSCPTASHQTSG